MVVLLAMVGLCAGLTIAAWRSDPWSPLAVSLALWGCVLGLLAIAPLRLNPVEPTAAVAICVGLICLVAPSLIMPRRSAAAAVSDGAPVFARFLMVSALMTGLVVLGVVAFRDDIASAAGAGFDALSLQQVRHAQVTNARGGGLLGILGAAPPILSCLGVYGALTHSRWWFVLSGIALGASLQTPARTFTLALVVCMVVFYFYARRGVVRSSLPTRRFSRRPVLIAALAAGTAFIAFNYFDAALGKDKFALSFFPQYSWPKPLLGIILYVTGGVSAFSTAIEANANPFAGQEGQSVFLFARLWNFIQPEFHSPETLGEFVNIPIPFNNFSAFGQIYFDYGMGGVALLSVLFGGLAVVAHRAAMDGKFAWIWVSAVMASLLFYTPAGFRLFFLDTVFQLGLGVFVFFFVRSRNRTVRAAGRRSPVARPVSTRPSEIT